MLANIAITVALLPALFNEGDGGKPSGPIDVAAGDTLETVPVVATAAGMSKVVRLEPGAVAARAATTTTTAPPPPTTVARRVAPTTTAAPHEHRAAPPHRHPTSSAHRTTTTTTTQPPRPKPKPTTTTTEPPEDGTESGKASWYDHQPGVCAHKSLPFGTVVTVTHTGNGKSTTCTVGDRGPYVEGWIIDLHPEQFEQLAPRSTGVIPVRISW